MTINREEIEAAIQTALRQAEALKRSTVRQKQISDTTYRRQLEQSVDTFIQETYPMVTNLIAQGRRTVKLVDLPEDTTQDFKVLLVKKINDLSDQRAVVHITPFNQLMLTVTV